MSGDKRKASSPEQSPSLKTAREMISGNPPWHAVATVVGLFAVFLPRLAGTLKSIDELATLDTFRHVLFVDILSLRAVLGFRLVCATVILLDVLYTFLYGKWEQATEYEEGTKLIPIPELPFRGCLLPDGNLKSGFMTLSSFTMWAWTLEGLAFLLTGLLPLLEESAPPVLQSIALVLWEISAPCTLLVSGIVKYVLWPTAQANGGNNVNVLQHPCALLEHNFNVVAAVTEVGLMGGLPCRVQHVVLAPLFGLAYVLFSWWMKDSWIADDSNDNNDDKKKKKKKEYGPQFIYPFMDTTMGVTTTLALLGLLVALLISFAIFAGLQSWLQLYGGGFWAHVAAVVLILSIVCKFR